MKRPSPSTVRVATMAAAFVAVISSLMSLLIKLTIPGLSPTAVTVMMIGLAYSVWMKYRDGLVSGRYLLGMSILFGLCALINILAAVGQISLALR